VEIMAASMSPAPTLTPTVGSSGGDYICLINLLLLCLSFSTCLSWTCFIVNVFLLCVCWTCDELVDLRDARRLICVSYNTLQCLWQQFTMNCNVYVRSLLLYLCLWQQFTMNCNVYAISLLLYLCYSASPLPRAAMKCQHRWIDFLWYVTH
jgi:hypothetical protein